MNNFFKDKKNIKIIIAALVVVLTVGGVVLGITISPSGQDADELNSSLNTSNTTYNTTAGNEANAGAMVNEANPLDPNAAVFNVTGSGGNGFGGEASAANTFPSGYEGNADNGGGSIQGNGGGASEPSAPAAITCSIAIDCSSISGNGALTDAGNPHLEPYAANPAILPNINITVSDTNGDGRIGVDEAIKEACNSYGIQYEFKGSNYVRGINYLYEFDAGPNSGWMYKVNGRIPNKGCNTYYLSGGEDILWYYVISY